MGFSDLGKKLSKLGQDTKNGVQKVSDSVSISNRISQEKKSLERLFALIGEAVYKENPETPKAGLEDEWAAVKVAYANIASYTDQLNHVKGIIYCPNCGRPAASGDKFCAKCGYKLNIRPETTGAKMAKDLKEAGQEVGKIAGDAADKTGEAVGGAAAGTKNAFSWLKEKLKKPKKAQEEPEASGEERKAAEAAKESAQTPGEQITETARESAQTTSEQITEAAREAGEQIAEAVPESAQETGVQDAEATQEVGEQDAEAAKESAQTTEESKF